MDVDSTKFDDTWSSSARTSLQGPRRSMHLHLINPLPDNRQEGQVKPDSPTPKRSSVQMLVSPFTRRTSILMVAESTSKYSICLPLDNDESNSNPTSSNSQTTRREHRESHSSIESFMQNAFSTDVNITLLDQRDFTFPLSPSLDSSEHDLKTQSPTIPRRRTRSGYASTIRRSKDQVEFLAPHSDDTLKVPAPPSGRSSIIRLFTPRSMSPTNAGSTSRPTTPIENTSESTSRGLMPLGNAKKGSSTRSVSSQAVPIIHTEIAQPTFVRSRAISMNLRDPDSKSTLRNNFLELGSDLISLTSKNIKHFKSESDLIKLKDSPPSRSESEVFKYPSKTSSESKEESQTSTYQTINESRLLWRSGTIQRTDSTVVEDESLMSLLR
jgi:hypothetical protein